MKQLSVIRFAISWVLIPVAGVFLTVYLLVTRTMQPWHLPLIAGMLGTPLVARGAPAPVPEQRDDASANDGSHGGGPA
jgi:hypothetical protein